MPEKSPAETTGWRMLLAGKFPPLGEVVEWRRDFGSPSWRRPFIADYADFPAEFNVAGLWWRPLGARLQELGLNV